MAEDQLFCVRSSPGDSVVKNLPAMTETWVRSLGREDPLEKGRTAHSSILAQGNPMDRGAWRATVLEVRKSGTRLSDQHFQLFCLLSVNDRIPRPIGQVGRARECPGGHPSHSRRAEQSWVPALALDSPVREFGLGGP